MNRFLLSAGLFAVVALASCAFGAGSHFGKLQTLTVSTSDLFAGFAVPGSGSAYFASFTSPAQLIEIKMSNLSAPVSSYTLTAPGPPSVTMNKAYTGVVLGTDLLIGTYVNPCIIGKFSTVSKTLTATTTLPSSPDSSCVTMALNPASTFVPAPQLLVSHQGNEFRRINANTFAVQSTLNVGSSYQTGVVSSKGPSPKAYFVESSLPSKIVQYFANTSVVSLNLLLDAGLNFVTASFQDSVSGLIYLATSDSSNYLIELRELFPSGLFEATGRLLYIGPDGVRAMAQDPVTRLVYIGTMGSPTAAVMLVNVTGAEMVIIETIQLALGEKRLASLALDHVARKIVFGTQSSPALGVAFSLADCPNNCFHLSGAGNCTARPDNSSFCSCGYLRGGDDCGTKLCLFNCNGPSHGSCDDGVCRCTSEWTGDFCEIPTCPGGCGEELAHGTCNAGTCACTETRDGKWTGPNCASFNLNCKPPTCSGHGTCPPGLSGVCQCDPGWTFIASCGLADSAAKALTIAVTLTKPYNRTEFIAFIAEMMDISPDCVFIVAEPPVTEPNTVHFTIGDCEQRGRPRTSQELVSEAVDRLNNGEGVALGIAGSKQTNRTGMASGLLAGIIVAAVVVVVGGGGGYYFLRRHLIKKLRAKIAKAAEGQQMEPVGGAAPTAGDGGEVALVH